MDIEQFEIPIENICEIRPDHRKEDEEKQKYIKIILNKLHTHKEFCANMIIDITFDHSGAVYQFKIHKGKFLYINGKKASELENNELSIIAEKCPVTTFISNLNKTLYEEAYKIIVTEGRRITKFSGRFANYKDKSEERFDIRYECKAEHYIYIDKVEVVNNRVKLTYREFSLIGNNWDSMFFKNEGYHTCIIDKYWYKLGLKTKKEFLEDIENQIKIALLNFTENLHKNKADITQQLNNL